MLGRWGRPALWGAAVLFAVWFTASCVPATPVADAPTGSQQVSVDVSGDLTWAASGDVESGLVASVDERGLLASLKGTVEIASEGGDTLRVTADATLVGDTLLGSLTVRNTATGRTVAGPVEGSPPVRVTVGEDGSWSYTLRANWLSFDQGIQSGAIVLTVGHAPGDEPTTTTTTEPTSTTTSSTSTSTTSTTTTTTTTTVPVGDPPVVVTAPSITGTPVAGSTLTVSPGVWSGTQPISYSVRFESCSLDGCITRQNGDSLTYTTTAADIGRLIRAAVTATNTAGETSATVDSAPITAPPEGPVVNHCGTLTTNETWAGNQVHVLTCTVTIPDSITLTVAPGAVVKLSCSGWGPEMSVESGGVLRVRDAILTSTGDDSAGGDTGDGNCDSSYPNWQIWTSTASGPGRPIVDLDGVIFRNGTIYPRVGNYELIALGTQFEDSEIGVGGADGKATIRNSVFDATRLSINNIDSSSRVESNTFRNQANPVNVSGDSRTFDLSSSASGNVFAGTTPRERLARVSVSVAAGVETVWQPKGAVLEAGGSSTFGVLTIAPGAVVKLSCSGWGPEMSVESGGVLRVRDAILTSTGDDSAGGDTGDGNCDSSYPNWQIWTSTASGPGRPIVDLDGVIFRNGTIYPRVGNYELIALGTQFEDSEIGVGGADGKATIRNSVFDATRLSINNIDSSSRVESNTFRNQANPVNVSGDSRTFDLSSSASGNVFAGTTPRERLARVSVSVAAGVETVWQPKGAVLEAGGSSTFGVLTIAPGAVVKLSCSGWGPEMSVESGGVLRVRDAILTSTGDDSAGGDTGDGNCDSSYPNWQIWTSTASGPGRPIVDLDGVIFRNGTIYPRVGNYELIALGTQFEDSEIGVGGADGKATIRNSVFDATRLSINNIDSSSRVESNTFRNQANPVNVSGDSRTFDLSLALGNRFEGNGRLRAVTFSNVRVPNGSDWEFDGSTNAVLVLNSTLRGEWQPDGDLDPQFTLRNGAIVKAAPGVEMFETSVNGGLVIIGTQANPVVLTSTYDDRYGGQSVAHGPEDPNDRRFAGVLYHFAKNPALQMIAGIAGVEPDLIGPGTVDVNHAVVRYADEGFFQCSVCELEVRNSDFIHVGMGVKAAYLWWPTAPCFAGNGNGIMVGTPPFSLEGLADARGNYWGHPDGPSGSFDPASLIGLRSEFWGKVAAVLSALPFDDPLRDALNSATASLKDNEGYGDAIPLSEAAKVNVDIQNCMVPVVNWSYPTVVSPVDYGDYSATPIHEAPPWPAEPAECGYPNRLNLSNSLGSGAKAIAFEFDPKPGWGCYTTSLYAPGKYVRVEAMTLSDDDFTVGAGLVVDGAVTRDENFDPHRTRMFVVLDFERGVGWVQANPSTLRTCLVFCTSQTFTARSIYLGWNSANSFIAGGWLSDDVFRLYLQGKESAPLTSWVAPAINMTFTVNAPGSISVAGDSFPETGASWWHDGALGGHTTRFASDPMGLCDYEVDGAAEQLCQHAATFSHTPAASSIRLIDRFGG